MNAPVVSNVFIAFQDNEESRPIIDAILADNPEATAVHSPGLVKIDAPGRLVVRRKPLKSRPASASICSKSTSTS